MPIKLKTMYETVEEIPEGFTDLYTERGGKFELTNIEGVKTQADIDRVQAALAKERKDHKEARDRLQAFGETDPASIPTLQEELAEAKARLETITAEGKVDEAKVEERINAAINRAVGPVTRDKDALARQLEAAKKAVADKEAEIATVRAEQTQERVRNTLRDAAIDGKVLGTAIDDSVLVGERYFEYIDGKLVTKADMGVTPGLTPKEWLKDMKEVRPHWWPLSQGGGAQGGRGGGNLANKDNPWSAENWNLTAQGVYLREHGEAKAGEMAARVGAKLGGPKPKAMPAR